MSNTIANPNRATRRRLGRGAVAIGAALTLGLGVTATTAFAVQPENPGQGPDQGEVSTTTLPLNSGATAQPEEDCPADGAAYWHFVVTPNSDKIVFDEIRLNLGAITYVAGPAQIVPNGDQMDNVFVAVPPGYELTSLVKAGTEATVTGEVRENSKFNLSHVCPGDTPPPPDVPEVPGTPAVEGIVQTPAVLAAAATPVTATPSVTG